MAPAHAPDPLARVWAVVPLRGLESAKTRLAPELDAEERLALVMEMAERTLAACRDAASLAGVVLVTLDPAAARLAEAYGARTIVQRLPGLNAAIREGRSLALEAGATAILVLPIDLPLVSADALDAVVTAASAAEAAAGIVAAVPERHGTGTNLLLVAPAEAIDPAFGPDSRRLHEAAARAAAMPWLELGGPLTLDVDTFSDLIAADTGHSPAATGATAHRGRDA